MQEDLIIGLAGTVGVFAFLIVTSVSAAWTIRHVTRLRAETLRLAIERGQPLPSAPPIDVAQRDARRGVLAIALGVGTAIALGVMGGLEVAALGAIPAVLGAGWLVTSRLGRAKQLPPPSGPSNGEPIEAPRHAVI